MRISDICKERRTELKLSNIVISEQSGINLQTVNNFFSQSKAPSIYTVGPICRVLGVSLDEVFEIIAPDMGLEEIERIKNQDHNQEEMLALQQEAEKVKEDALKTIDNQKEIIRRQDIRMEELNERKTELNDRIKSQVFVINIFRVWILALHVYALFMDAMVPDSGLIRGLEISASEGMVTVSVIIIITAFIAISLLLKYGRTKKKKEK